MPPLLVEVGIGLFCPLLLVVLRMALLPWVGELAPFAMVFVAFVGAAVLAGWRAGLIALIVGQSLIWVFIMEPRGSSDSRIRFTWGPWCWPRWPSC